MDFFAPDIEGVVDLFLTAFTSAHSPGMHNALAIRAARYTTPTELGSRTIAPMLDDPASRKRPSKKDSKKNRQFARNSYGRAIPPHPSSSPEAHVGPMNL
ncbi:hypothetical protein [Variovorax sp. DAIF25]|uniref:hypothetical protein n=1 Tax=Variovorax sp. DAIF25 TaxID=3080983 RepID=UPI003D6B6D05